jgi:hypothetical protein
MFPFFRVVLPSIIYRFLYIYFFVHKAYSKVSRSILKYPSNTRRLLTCSAVLDEFIGNSAAAVNQCAEESPNPRVQTCTAVLSVDWQIRMRRSVGGINVWCCLPQTERPPPVAGRHISVYRGRGSQFQQKCICTMEIPHCVVYQTLRQEQLCPVPRTTSSRIACS